MYRDFKNLSESEFVRKYPHIGQSLFGYERLGKQILYDRSLTKALRNRRKPSEQVPVQTVEPLVPGSELSAETRMWTLTATNPITAFLVIAFDSIWNKIAGQEYDPEIIAAAAATLSLGAEFAGSFAKGAAIAGVGERRGGGPSLVPEVESGVSPKSTGPAQGGLPRKLALHRGTVGPWATRRVIKAYGDLGEGTYYSLEQLTAMKYADMRREQYLQSLPKSAEGKVASSPPGIVLTSELAIGTLKVLDFYHEPLRGEFERWVRKTYEKSSSPETADRLLSGQLNLTEIYNALFYGWARSELHVEPDTYDVIIGPEFARHGSQVRIKDPNLVTKLDAAASITAIATDRPKP
jgi:hypothetical protein